MYKATKTIQKAATPPIFIIALSSIAQAILKKMEVEIEQEHILEIMILVYGAFSGLVNFTKHIKK